MGTAFRMRAISTRVRSSLRFAHERIAVCSAAAALVSAGLMGADADGRATAEDLPLKASDTRAFSGRLIARPLQPQDARERGIDEVERLRLRRIALAAMPVRGIHRSIPETDEFIVEVPEDETEAIAIDRMPATGGFAYVEPDWILRPAGLIESPMGTVWPDDIGFPKQWHHAPARLGTVHAWSIQTGLPSIVVAIRDTGIRATHEDLAANRVEGFNAVSELWEGEGGVISDATGHGTAVTGAAAAIGGNGVGVAGIAWDVRHRMMRITDDDGFATLSALTLAARRAAEIGDRVINISFSGATTQSAATTGSYVRSLGSLLFWAAGNSTAEMMGDREDDLIIVGATGQTDHKARFSNYGPKVDLFAPGMGIPTTHRSGDAAYFSTAGTSIASPIAAGVAALIWSQEPTLTPGDVEGILRSSARNLGSPGVDDIYGYGRVDAARAIASRLGGMEPPPSDTIVADGFESGDLNEGVGGGWIVENDDAFATMAAAYSGAWGARIRKSSSIEIGASTRGLAWVTVGYARRTKNLVAGRKLRVEWWNGAHWELLEQTNAGKFTELSFVLPIGAWNNPNFRLRFVLNANATSSHADIDDVVIFGLPLL